MPLTVKLTKPLADNIWLAKGTLTNSEGANFAAEVLVQAVDDNTAELILDSNLHPSTVKGRAIVAYFNETTAPVEKGFKQNVKVEFNHFSLKLRKQ